MKVKLIKVDGTGYYNLENERGTLIGTTFEFKSHVGDNVYALSHKNCQAIERGYDLDELAIKYASEFLKRPVVLYSPLEGNTSEVVAFQKGFQKALDLMKHRLVEETEWQVEVLMDICGDKVYAVPEPFLDEQGCLILKRIYN